MKTPDKKLIAALALLGIAICAFIFQSFPAARSQRAVVETTRLATREVEAVRESRDTEFRHPNGNARSAATPRDTTGRSSTAMTRRGETPRAIIPDVAAEIARREAAGERALQAFPGVSAAPGAASSDASDISRKGRVHGRPTATLRAYDYIDPSGLVLELEAGTKPPLVLFEDTEKLTPPQAKAVERITADFALEVQAASATAADEAALSLAWDDARRRADERYHILIGNDAYLLASMRAIREAVQRSPAQGQP